VHVDIDPEKPTDAPGPLISSSLPKARDRPGSGATSRRRPVTDHFSLRFHLATLEGYDYDTECAATKRTGYWTSTLPERVSFAKPLSSCERPATKSKHSSTPLTRPDGFTAGANSRASKWISTFLSTVASEVFNLKPTRHGSGREAGVSGKLCYVNVDNRVACTRQ
jgi:hypothetical protein